MSSGASKCIAIIPARMGSSRFAGKPLAPILGRPMIEHVYQRTAMSKAVGEVYVATCDAEIRDAVEAFGGRAIMTSTSHQRASDRVAEAARSLDADIVVMVQGDEPMTVPRMLEQAVAPLLEDPSVECVDLAKRIGTEREFLDPNTIKVTRDRAGDAIYFSREPIPTRRLLGFDRLAVFKQVCIIPFRKKLLATYAALAPTPLEQAESIDMLRLLEHGYRVRLVETEYETQSVDTAEDLRRVEALMRDDPLTRDYLGGNSPRL
jgi:3-deoxy-manno-octulosonate cytidylyltransferase (CMP-KDO synthetase)